MDDSLVKELVGENQYEPQFQDSEAGGPSQEDLGDAATPMEKPTIQTIATAEKGGGVAKAVTEANRFLIGKRVVLGLQENFARMLRGAVKMVPPSPGGVFLNLTVGKMAKGIEKDTSGGDKALAKEMRGNIKMATKAAK